MGLINQSSVCKKCGRYSLSEVCTFCVQSPNLFEKARAYCIYSEISSTIIKDFKYYNKIICKNFVVEKMCFVFKTHFSDEKIDFITAVPMNAVKEWWKGCNHSQKLATEIAKHFNLSYKGVLKKSFAIKRQALLNKKQRLKNIQNTIFLKNKSNIEGKTILLIDDTITTGATVSECCKILLKNGAKKILVLTFAKSIADETNY